MDIDELKSWFVSELEFSGQLPDDEQLKSLCTGSMRDVWNHLIKHCKSQEKAKIIRANVAIASRKQNSLKNSLSVTSSQLSLQDNGERDELIAERSMLTSQLHTTLANIQRLTKDIRDAEEYKLTTLQTQFEKEEEIKKLRKSHTLLSLYRKQVDSVVIKLNSLTEKINKHYEGLKEKRNMSKRSESVSDARLEGPADRQVKRAVEKVMSHMKQVLLSSAGISRASLREELQQSLCEMSGTCLQLALVNNAHNQMDRIAQHLTNFDLKQEAESLRHESEGGQSGALVSFVRDEVDLLNKRYLNSYQELMSTKKRLSALGDELENLYSDNMENILDATKLRSSLKRSFESGVEEQKIVEFENYEAKLRDMEVAEENQQQVITWTRNSEANVQDMVNLISMLIESRTSSHKKLQSRKKVTLDLVKSLPEIHCSLSSCISKSKNEPDDMMNTFLQLPVSRYSSTVVEDKTGFSLVPTPDLAINRLSHRMQYPGKKQVKIDQEALTNSNMSFPNLTYKVYGLLSDIDELKQERQKCDESSDVKSLFESVRQLPRNLNDSKVQQVKDFLPLVQKTGEMCTEGAELCQRVQTALADYDSQYTQTVVGKDDGLLVEARNLAQWQEALRVAILHT